MTPKAYQLIGITQRKSSYKARRKSDLIWYDGGFGYDADISKTLPMY